MLASSGKSLTTRGRVFYVDATNGSDSNTGLTPAQAWQTCAKVNTTALNPGEMVRFKTGELWRETLAPLSSGGSGSPITFSSYGGGQTAPTICGADITALTWTDTGGNVWTATRATDPGVIRVNGTFGTEKASVPALTAPNDWFWDGATTVSLFSTSDPGGKTVEMAARNFAIAVTKNYVVIENFIAEMTTAFGNIALATGCNNVTVRNCEVRYSDLAGIIVYTDASAPHLIEGNTVHHCVDGILGLIHTAASSGNEVVVRANECYSNTQAGIMCRANWWIIEKNSCHDNGVTTIQAMGIWVISASLGEGTGDRNVIRYNRCFNNTGSSFDGGGIALDQFCDNNDVYGNVCYANRSYGIIILDGQFCNIYNNTCYGNETEAGMFSGEISITSSASPNNRTSDLNVKNNIGYSTQASSVAIFIDANTTGNANIVIDNNIWFGTSTNWWTAGATNGTNLATWNAFAWVGTDVNSDPTLTNVGSNVYTLASGSPAINTGLDLGSTYQLALDPPSSWPNNVYTANQNSFGAGWEKGGYVFKG